MLIPELLDHRWAGGGNLDVQRHRCTNTIKKDYIFYQVEQLYGDILANPEGYQYLFYARL